MGVLSKNKYFVLLIFFMFSFWGVTQKDEVVRQIYQLTDQIDRSLASEKINTENPKVKDQGSGIQIITLKDFPNENSDRQRSPASLPSTWVVGSRKLQIKGQAPQNFKLLSVTNLTNGYSGTLFNAKKIFQTDFIDLNLGENIFELTWNVTQSKKAQGVVVQKVIIQRQSNVDKPSDINY